MSNQPKRSLAQAAAVAEQIVSGLAPLCERIEIAGSIRRQRPEVGDIEIVVVPLRQKNLFGEPLNDRQNYLDRFLLDQQVPLIKNGPKYKQFMDAGFSVDLFTPLPEQWGLRLIQGTDSREFNIWLVDQAMRGHGYRLMDGRVVDSLHNEYPLPEEQDLFNLLALPFVPPQKRDDNQWLDLLGVGETAKNT